MLIVRTPGYCRDDMSTPPCPLRFLRRTALVAKARPGQPGKLGSKAGAAALVGCSSGAKNVRRVPTTSIALLAVADAHGGHSSTVRPVQQREDVRTCT